MIKLSLIDFFLRLIPEGLLFIFAGYILSNKEIDKKKLFISGLILAVTTFFVRSLPINFGVHTLILILINVILGTLINKFEITRAISAIMISVIIMFIGEFLNVFLLGNIMGIDLATAFENPILKNIYSIPSLAFFVIVILLIRRVIKKR